MVERVRVEGLKDLEKALIDLRHDFNLSRASVKGVVRRAMVESAKPVKDDAERRAPRLSGQLQESFATGTKLTRRQRRLHQKESELEIFVGPGGLAQAVTQEFGTVNHGPQPFLRPAWDSKKMDVLKTFSGKLAEQIMKSAKRAARKAERLAAKIKAGT